MKARKQKSYSKQDKKQSQTKLFQKQIVKVPQSPQKKKKSKKFSAQNIQSVGQIKTSTSKWSYGSGKTPYKLLISSWNVNGVRAVIKKQQLQNYIQKIKPDIICINETKIDQTGFNNSEKLEFSGYHQYWNFCKNAAGYSGVAIFSKYLPISLVEDLPQKQHSQEGRVLTMEFQKFYLVSAYIPNAGFKLDRLQYRVSSYDQAFQSYCQSLRTKKTTIICGDLNVSHKQIDLANPKINTKTAGFTIEQRNNFNEFLQKGWVDTFRHLHPQTVKYSWWSMRTKGRQKNIGWRLDYFLVNKEAISIVKDSKINNQVFGSDHCPIQLEVQLT